MSVFDRVVRLLKRSRCGGSVDLVSYPYADAADNITHDKRNYRGGVHPYSAGREQAVADLGCVRVLAQELSSELVRALQHGERVTVRVGSSALIAAAKRVGCYIPYEERARFGDMKRRRSGESEIYAGTDYAYLVKFKDPEAKQPLKSTEPTDWLFEHIIHNILFPEARYEFLGVSDVGGCVRLILQQKCIDAVAFPTEEMIAGSLEAIGLAPEARYSFGNDVLAVTDVGARGDNVLLGGDGCLYFIDPIVRLKRPALKVIAWLVGDCEIVSRLFEMYAELTKKEP